LVSLEKYHETVKSFLDCVAEDGKELAVSDRTLYVYEKGAWAVASNTQSDALDRMLRSVSDDTQFPFSEKYSQLWRHVRSSLKLVEPEQFDECGKIAVNNGTLDPRDGTLTEHDPADMITRRASVKYDPDAKCPHWLKMLDRIVEGKSEKDAKEYISFLQQWFGLAIVGYRNLGGRQFRKLVVLHGPERTGKTTVADVLRKLIGEKDVTSEDLETVSSRFGLANIARSKALIGDDAVGLKSKVNAAVLKKLITGEPMTADRKMRDAINFRFNGPILVTSNNLPRIEDSTHALYGRCVVLTFERQFGPEDAALLDGLKPESFLARKREFPGILNWALRGLERVIEKGELPVVSEASEAGNVWRAENDPVFAFIREHCVYDPKVLNYVPVISAAVSVYAEVQMADRSYPPKRCRNLVGREAKQLLPGVKNDRRPLHKVQTRCLVGLKLSEDGKRYVDMAYEKNLLQQSARWTVNDKAL